jgi:hypothetical protein
VYFFGDHVGPIGTVFFSYVFILISNSIPTFEKNRAKSALVSDLPKTSNNNIKTFLQTITSSKNRILFFPRAAGLLTAYTYRAIAHVALRATANAAAHAIARSNIATFF